MMFQMFYTSDKLTNVFECVMFVSQFHVHCKIGTLTHRITFDFKRKLIPDDCENHSKALAVKKD